VVSNISSKGTAKHTEGIYSLFADKSSTLVTLDRSNSAGVHISRAASLSVSCAKINGVRLGRAPEKSAAGISIFPLRSNLPWVPFVFIFFLQWECFCIFKNPINLRWAWGGMRLHLWFTSTIFRVPIRDARPPNMFSETQWGRESFLAVVAFVSHSIQAFRLVLTVSSKVSTDAQLRVKCFPTPVTLKTTFCLKWYWHWLYMVLKFSVCGCFLCFVFGGVSRSPWR